MPPEFPTLNVAGETHFGLGLAIGEQFRLDIQETVRQRRETVGQEKHRQFLRRARDYAEQTKTFLPQTWNTLVGITMGANINLMESVYLNTHELQDPTNRCLTIVSPNQNSAIVGQIEEWDEPGAENSLYLLRAKIQEGNYARALIGLCYKAELPWTAIALTDSNIVQAINSLESYHTGLGVPRVAIASALAEAENLDWAERTIGRLPRASAFNHVLVHGRRTTNIEAANGFLSVQNRIGEVLVHGNHFVSDGTKDHGPAPSVESLSRYNLARQMVRPEMSFQEMASTLSQLSHPDTLARAIVEPEHRRLTIRRNHEGAQFTSYTL